MTILLIDDDPAVLRCMSAMARSEGYEVLQADGAAEALALCQADEYFDLVVSDVCLPHVSGYALAQCMGFKLPNAHIIFVSGDPFSAAIKASLKQRGFKSRDYSYIQKPFLGGALMRAVNAVLKGDQVRLRA